MNYAEELMAISNRLSVLSSRVIVPLDAPDLLYRINDVWSYVFDGLGSLYDMSTRGPVVAKRVGELALRNFSASAGKNLVHAESDVGKVRLERLGLTGFEDVLSASPQVFEMVSTHITNWGRYGVHGSDMRRFSMIASAIRPSSGMTADVHSGPIRVNRTAHWEFINSFVGGKYIGRPQASVRVEAMPDGYSTYSESSIFWGRGDSGFQMRPRLDNFEDVAVGHNFSVDTVYAGSRDARCGLYTQYGGFEMIRPIFILTETANERAAFMEVALPDVPAAEASNALAFRIEGAILIDLRPAGEVIGVRVSGAPAIIPDVLGNSVRYVPRDPAITNTTPEALDMALVSRINMTLEELLRFAA